jgi:hypothetical protein
MISELEDGKAIFFSIMHSHLQHRRCSSIPFWLIEKPDHFLIDRRIVRLVLAQDGLHPLQSKLL